LPIVKLPGILVTQEWVGQQLDSGIPASDLVLADVRWVPGGSAQGSFEAGHLPGAVSIDVDRDLARSAFDGPGRHPLPSPGEFAERMARAGIGDGVSVIAYDDSGGSVAARLWWMLWATGHDAALMDLPSLEAWTARGQLETGPADRERATFAPREWPPGLVADAADVHGALLQGGTVVIDARAEERYRGDVEPFDPVAGHIPGALSASWTGNRDPTGGRFLSPSGLRARFAELGVHVGTDAIAYCGSGVTATMDIFAMELAGVHGCKLYEGSWSDWVGDGTRPVARGAEPGELPRTPDRDQTV
jgi:thiosulfate/3-mercaptopyruvate sulfurtransferase